MATPVDIACPECERTAPVEKLALDRYRCTHCGTEFSPRDVLPEE
ncbi:MAG: hypothetical protein ABEJ42_07880 [Halobacteriaceae archaeon]